MLALSSLILRAQFRNSRNKAGGEKSNAPCSRITVRLILAQIAQRAELRLRFVGSLATARLKAVRR